MELSNVVAVWCAVMSTLQGFGAALAIVDRQKKLDAEGLMTYKANRLMISIALLLGAFVTIAFSCWMFFAKPLRPTVVNVPQIVEKTVPCPPSKSGAASSRGNNSPANSGSNNPTTYGQSAPTDKTSH